MTALEIATFLGVRRITVYRMIEDGRLPVLRWGKILRIPREAFLEWYKAHGKEAIW